MSTRIRTAHRSGIALLLGLALLPGLAAAQPSMEQIPSLSIGVRVITTAFITLLAGGAYFAFAESSAERTMERARTEPVESFLWGLGVGIALIIVSVILAITIIGLIVAIPLLIVFAVVQLAAQAVVFVVIVRSVFDETLEIGKALVGAAVFAGILAAIPLIGPLIQFVVGSVAVGAVVLNYRE